MFRALAAARLNAWSARAKCPPRSDEIADREPKVYAAIDNAGIVHGKGMKSYLIMMAVRLLELRRVLKATGSLYLHCDPTADAYLRMLLDAVFGAARLRNQITWKRNSSHNDSKGFGNVTDTILFYGGPIDADAVRVSLNPDYVSRMYRHTDRRGKYQAYWRYEGDIELSAKGLTGGGYHYEFHGHDGPWRHPQQRMMELEADERIHIGTKPGGVPRLKRYLGENKGQVPSNLWTDIEKASTRERSGFPTQKPLALLDRIIKASSNTRDVVLDPFCGCATACVSAESLNRQWIGIDLSPVAATLVESRLRDQFGVPPFSETSSACSPRSTTEPTFPGAPTWATCRTTGPTSTNSSGNRKATAPDAG